MEIKYEDKYILIAVKPAGEPSQPDNSGVKSLAERAEEHTGQAVHIITRLDRPVSGLVLFAKDKDTASKLSAMLENNDITKIYHALVCGDIKEEGSIESYIMKNSRLNISKIVNKGNIGARYALLHYKLIERGKETNKAEIRLVTGRHHQIRAQFASIGAPLYGDTKYNEKFRHKRNMTLALCACALEFEHPVTGEHIKVRIDDGLEIK